MNTAPSAPAAEPQSPPFPMPWLIIIPAATAVLVFLLFTPGDVLTKMDLVGYAVCHRLEEHSLSVAGRQLPLCARCTGTFIGALVGFFGQAVVLRRRRSGRFPPLFVLLTVAGFMLLWAADGLNSYMELIQAPHLYEPQNELRLLTGSLNGLAMSVLVYPVFNFTLWRDPVDQPAVRNLRDVAVLVLLEAGLVAAVLFVSDSGIAALSSSLASLPPPWSFLRAVADVASALGVLLLYPLGLLSAFGVLALLTTVNSMLVLMIVRRENVARTWRHAAIPLLAGFTVSLIQVGAIDFIRYMLTGALSGIPPFGPT